MESQFFTVIGVYDDSANTRFAETVLSASPRDAEEAVLRVYPEVIVAAVVAGSPDILDVEYSQQEAAEERVEVVYTVTVSVPEDAGLPTDEEIQRGVYQGSPIIDSMAAVQVERH